MFKIKLHGGKTMEVPEEMYWHTTSHIMAQAVQRLYPGTKITIGPAIEEGFYYDFDSEETFSPEDLEKITDEMQKIALTIKPHSVCLVPEKREEVTTEGGLDVAGQLDKITKFIVPLKAKGIEVSLFIDPDEKQVRASAQTGAQFIEMHTGSYSNAFATDREDDEFQKLKNAAKLAQELGLRVNAGHGLDYKNVGRMHEIAGLYELNIGHSIISRAIFTGLESAVKEMQELVK